MEKKGRKKKTEKRESNGKWNLEREEREGTWEEEVTACC